MIVVCIANQKGGVGKTTTAVTLAHGLALRGQPTLLVDLDPQGQCSTALGMIPEPGIFSWLVAEKPLPECVRPARLGLTLLPGDRTTTKAQLNLALDQAPIYCLADKLARLARTNLRYIVIDTAPTLGGLQERALYASDLVIIPTRCDFLSADAVAKTYQTMQANLGAGWKGRLFGVLPTFWDTRAHEPRQVLADLCSAYPGLVIEPAIHQATALAEAAANGQTIWEWYSKSRSALEYAALLYAVMDAK